MIAAMEYHHHRLGRNIHPQQKLPLKKIKSNCPDNHVVYSWEYVDVNTSYDDAQVRRVLVNGQWYMFTF